MKYKIERTKNGWEIFEHGTSWGVGFPTAEEAYSMLFAVVRSLEAATEMANEI